MHDSSIHVFYAGHAYHAALFVAGVFFGPPEWQEFFGIAAVLSGVVWIWERVSTTTARYNNGVDQHNEYFSKKLSGS